MGSAKLKWALGVSLFVNLFLIAGVIAAGTVLNHHMHDFKRPPAGTASWDMATQKMTPESRDRIKSVIKTAALSGEPEMDKARALRQQAAQMAAQDPYDAAKIIALSDQARSYENLARGKIETALVTNMAVLPATERGAIAGFMLRPTFRFRRFIDKDHSPQQQAPTPGAPADASQASQ